MEGQTITIAVDATDNVQVANVTISATSNGTTQVIATMPAAPAIIECAASPALPAPIAAAVTASEASATDGAPENKPASVFGCSRSLIRAKATTRLPPAMALRPITPISFNSIGERGGRGSYRPALGAATSFVR